MSRTWLLFPLLLGACAIQPPHPDTFSFAVVGDTPYSADEEIAFDAIVDRMNQERLAFVAHVGDLKSSRAPCSDEMYRERRARFDRSLHPFAYTPGDNEWVDCRSRRAGSHDPLERLAKLREVFFPDARFMGRTPGPATQVQEGYPENRRWTIRSVAFATLNVQGSNDNVGFDARNDAEAARRGEANRRWLEAAFATPGASAVVIIFQANPFRNSKQRVYDALVASIAKAAIAFRGPALVVHGNTHFQRVDKPFADEQGRAIENLTRLESFGSPFAGWVRVTADPNDARFFRFETRGPGPAFP